MATLLNKSKKKRMAQAAQKTKLLLPLQEQRWNLRII